MVQMLDLGEFLTYSSKLCNRKYAYGERTNLGEQSGKLPKIKIKVKFTN